ncbi:SCO3242 family prenyltransferase [Kitasatospora sp. NPDC001261]|uniref:SCO3242 family prenyltransferase n=1 Tax=Kitasatospora sp. NPDC001261 TaxID=3364012 RepID=UPI0036A4A4ED
MRIPSLGTVAELVRAPAAITVPGDPLVGATLAGRPLGPATGLLALSSVCLYWAGMALNDYADRHTDAVERPHRPIPSGRVEPSVALSLAAGLTGTGLAFAAAGGGRGALSVAVPLAAVVWSYDLGLKGRPVAGPVTMAAARGLDVLLGAGGRGLRAAAPAAAVVGAHTLVVCALSRHEVRGADGLLLPATAAATCAVAAVAAAPGAGGAPGRRAVRLAALAVYVAGFGGAQAAAGRLDPRRLQQAVTAGIAAVLPLQAACACRADALPVALSLLAAAPVARRLFRKLSPT